MNEESQFIYNELKKEGYPLLINRQQYCKIVDISISTLNNRFRSGIEIPNYKREGNWKNSKILFNLKDVAEFIVSKTIKTA